MDAHQNFVKRSAPSAGSRHQGGFALIEAMIGILLFSLGILALVALQAVSIQQATAAQYRTEASFVANELLAQMWMGNRTTQALTDTYATGATGYTAWFDRFKTSLPGMTANPPTVVVAAATPAPGIVASSIVTITVSWLPPNEPTGTTPHNFVLVSQIK